MEDPKVLCLRIPAGLVEVEGAACILVEAVSVDLDISVLRFCSKACCWISDCLIAFSISFSGLLSESVEEVLGPSYEKEDC